MGYTYLISSSWRHVSVLIQSTVQCPCDIPMCLCSSRLLVCRRGASVSVSVDCFCLIRKRSLVTFDLLFLSPSAGFVRALCQHPSSAGALAHPPCKLMSMFCITANKKLTSQSSNSFLPRHYTLTLSDHQINWSWYNCVKNFLDLIKRMCHNPDL